MNRSYNVSSFLLLQIAIGIYFTTKGLVDIIGFNSGVLDQAISDFNKLMGKSNSYWPLIIGILFLIAGIVLISGVVFGFRKRVVYFLILVLWIVFIVNSHFMSNFVKGGFLVWFKSLSYQLIILAGLWGITQKN